MIASEDDLTHVYNNPTATALDYLMKKRKKNIPTYSIDVSLPMCYLVRASALLC